MAGDVDDVVDAPSDPVVAVGGAAAAVAGLALVGREVGLLEAGVVAIDRAHRAQPGADETEIAGGLAFQHLAEIVLFQQLKKPIIPLDVDHIRDRQGWFQDEVLFIADTNQAIGPSVQVTEAVMRGVRHWRVARIARAILAASVLSSRSPRALPHGELFKRLPEPIARKR